MKLKIALGIMLILSVAVGLCVTGVGESSVPEDGLYSIAVDSDSKMFKVVGCLLRVRDGNMSATITLSGQGYGYVFPGTGAEAEAAPRESWIPYVEDADGKYCYEIPISALDQEIEVAGWSKKYEKWYDRKLNFRSQTLSAYNLIPEDGHYSAVGEVDGAKSECVLNVREGKIYATFDSRGWKEVALSSLDQAFCVDVQSNGSVESHWIEVDSKTLKPRAVMPEDGTYVVGCSSDSGLFQVVECELEVQDGEMTTCILVQKSTYDKIWIGVPANARTAPEEEYIAAEEREDGTCLYRIPMESLERELTISTWSQQQSAWYERTLSFDWDNMIEGNCK